ncbi:MAG: SOS response-associated peptidase [Actinomycetia bacterium]|nr:SOS response-associated peptidase [Actinomycetes bacterium]
MCGRYASAKDPDALVEEFEVDESLVDKPLHADYNVAPTKSVYAVVSRQPEDGSEGAKAERQLRVVRWGLVPSWAKDPSIGSRMINARAETVADKPAFRRAFGRRRCLLPADGYYEWYTPTGENVPQTSRGKPVKQPFFIHRADGRSLAMAGLYEWWHDKSRESDDPEAWLLTATIITTSATDAVGRIHDRMPVVIAESDWQRWLDPAVGEREEIAPLMVPAQSSPLAAYPVSVRVNSVRNNGPELLEPLPLEEAVPGSVETNGLWPP